MRNCNVDNVRQNARGRWPSVLATLAPELEQALARPGRHVPCPVHSGRDGFRLFHDFADTGGGVCNTCGASADGFALLEWLLGWPFNEVVDAVAQTLDLDAGDSLPGVGGTAPTPAAPRSEQADAKLRAWLRQTWADALPLSDPDAGLAQRYLRSRGIPTWVASSLRNVRLHPSLNYRDRDQGRLGRWPALIMLVVDAAGEPVTLHRTYLAWDGNGKAPVPSPKRCAPVPNGRSLTGGAAPVMCAPFRSLGIAEGFETALAAYAATGLPVWPALNATLLERFVVPEDIDVVHIWADKDANGAGQQAASRLAEQVRAQGKRAWLHVPGIPLSDDKGVDWLDVFNVYGRWGFPYLRPVAPDLGATAA